MKAKGCATVGREPTGPRPFIRRCGESQTTASTSTVGEIGAALRRLRCAVARMQDVDPTVLDVLHGLERSHERLRSCSADRGAAALADLYGGMLRIRSMLLAEHDRMIH